MARALAFLLLATSAWAQPMTLTPHGGVVTLEVESSRVKCPVSLELVTEGQRVRALTLTFDTTKLSGDEAKRMQQMVFLGAPMSFTATEVKLKALPDEEATAKGFFGRATSLRASELTASGTFRLAGKERKLVLKGVLTRSEADAFGPAKTTVRIDVPALRRADFGLSTDLPRPRVEMIGFPLLSFSGP